PVCMDLEAIHVADNQERRVFQRDGIALQLREGGIQVFALALVFPTEAAALPDVGPALSAGRFRRALLEGVPFALRVGIARRALTQNGAQVVEMRLRGRALGQLRGLPFVNERFGGHLDRVCDVRDEVSGSSRRATPKSGERKNPHPPTPPAWAPPSPAVRERGFQCSAARQTDSRSQIAVEFAE